MDLLTDTILERLAANGRGNHDRQLAGLDTIDHRPVVKLFTPDAGATWLLTETHPNDPDVAFGLCDLGVGCPEIGSVRLSDIRAVRGRLGLPVERDLHFEPDATLGTYAERARAAGGIVA